MSEKTASECMGCDVLRVFFIVQNRTRQPQLPIISSLSQGTIQFLLTYGETWEPKGLGQGKAREPKTKGTQRTVEKKAGDRGWPGLMLPNGYGLGRESGVST